MRIYLAAPIVGISQEQKKQIDTVYDILQECGNNVYNPAYKEVPNAWGMTAREWSKCVFAMDVIAINEADWIVVCDYGRQGTAGTAWEVGYAFGMRKKILVIYMNHDGKDYSVMMSGCSSNDIDYENLISCFDGERNVEPNYKFVEDLFIERGRIKNDEKVYN